MANYTASYEGVSSVLAVRFGSVCDTNTSANNFDTAWTMLASHNGAGGYVQSGFFRWYGSNIFNFAEINQTGGAFDRIFGAQVSVGSTHRYWSQWDPACLCMHENVDTTRIANTAFNPFAVWTTPFSYQYFGETKYLESDMPGTASAPTSFTSISVQKYDDSWTLIPNPFLTGSNNNATRWGFGTTSSTSFKIWTK